MPWKTYEENGRFCVHKLNADGTSGDVVACHDTKEEADAQVKALYANEPGMRSADLDNLVEKRSVPFTDMELNGNHFRGYAAVYDQTTDLGQMTEAIQRGAFRKSLSRGENVPMLWDHNDLFPPFATTAGGTLTLKEDGKGLLVDAEIDQRHIFGPTLMSLVDNGDVRGMSFGFVAGKGNSRVSMTGQKPHRDLLGFNKILDVSPTWNPAYAGTDASFRSLSAPQTSEDIERVQTILLGEYRQLEDVAPVEEDDTNVSEEAVEETVDRGEETPQGDETPDDGQRSGATNYKVAAMKRMLVIEGLTLPKDLRS